MVGIIETLGQSRGPCLEYVGCGAAEASLVLATSSAIVAIGHVSWKSVAVRRGFRVIHTSGHAPGQIALFREPDRLLIAADAIYTLDTNTPAGPQAPAFPIPSATRIRKWRESIRLLIPLQPTSGWTGHAEAVTGDDIAQQLERGADYRLDDASY